MTAPTPAAPAGTTQTAALLAGEGLTHSFGATRALDDVAVHVRAGELLCLMGSSGSGKSTLLQVLAGILRPDAGHVSYRGRDLYAMSDAERSALRRQEFGFVFQFGQLVPELTCAENVALPLRLYGVRRAAARRRAVEHLDRLGVAEIADKRPGEVSGGQGQRAAVARALITQPTVIFADEPTGALDSLSGERVMQALVEAARTTGAAVVLVTHEARVAAYSDREVIVRDGRVREPELLP